MKTEQFIKYLEKKFGTYPGGIREGWSHYERLFFYDDVINLIKPMMGKNPYAHDYLIIYTSHYNYKEPPFLLMDEGIYHRVYEWEEFLRWTRMHYEEIIKRQKWNDKHKWKVEDEKTKKRKRKKS